MVDSVLAEVSEEVGFVPDVLVDVDAAVCVDVFEFIVAVYFNPCQYRKYYVQRELYRCALSTQGSS